MEEKEEMGPVSKEIKERIIEREKKKMKKEEKKKMEGEGKERVLVMRM